MFTCVAISPVGVPNCASSITVGPWTHHLGGRIRGLSRVTLWALEAIHLRTNIFTGGVRRVDRQRAPMTPDVAHCEKCHIRFVQEVSR
jgi:hypothetical protein